MGDSEAKGRKYEDFNEPDEGQISDGEMNDSGDDDGIEDMDVQAVERFIA